MPHKLGALIRRGTEQLTNTTDHDSTSPRRDAEMLAAHVIQKSRAWVIAHDDESIADAVAENFHKLISRRTRGEPIAYLTGYRDFWDRQFTVTPDTLIPRPETELLIEHLLKCFDESPKRVADIGTGSGAIAVSLAMKRPSWKIVATDISSAALDVAKKNGEDCQNLTFLTGSWCNPLTGDFDIIVSNPPYVRDNDPHLNALTFEPQSALTAGPDGLKAYSELIPQCIGHLKPGGTILLEHGYDQANDVAQILEQTGFRNIETLKDLAQHQRATLATR